MAGPQLTVAILKLVYPILVLVYFGTVQAYASCFLPPSVISESQNLKTGQKWRKWLVIGLSTLVASYAIEFIALLLGSFVQASWEYSESTNAFLLLSVLVWSIQLLTRIRSRSDFWLPFYGSWLLGFILELTIQTIQTLSKTSLAPLFWFQTAFVIFRLSNFIALSFQLYFNFYRKQPADTDEESQSLLGHSKTQGTEYGTTPAVDDQAQTDKEQSAEDLYALKKSLVANSGWWAYLKTFSVLVPFLFPAKSRFLQLRLTGVLLCVLGLRFFNVLIPRQLGLITDSLASGKGTLPWLDLGLYVLFRILGESGSGLDALQSIFYLPVQQYTTASVTEASYNKIIDLSMDFHSNKRSGHLLSSIQQGRSLASLAESVSLTLIPMILDLIVASWYFLHLFGSTVALILVLTVVAYLYSVTSLAKPVFNRLAPWLSLHRATHSRLVESIGNWETINFFNRQDYEKSKFKETYQKENRAWIHYFIAQQFSDSAQSLIFTLGFFSAAFFVVQQICHGKQNVGSFVTLLAYWASITGPISFFGHLGQRITRGLLEAEELVQLLRKEPSVRDKPSAQSLSLTDGSVEFKNVDFAYDQRTTVLHDISFRIDGGQTVALVGETGGGKSTILRLLFRFYDVVRGAIEIDGQDLRDVTLHSLREAFGVVPQHPLLFNDTIAANLRYARQDCTDEEMKAACVTASVHDKIMTFKDGYNTLVGERGVKLSGGEVQRIAIARAVLKNSKIVLLDEATNSVDVETETNIQRALENLVKGRTTFVIAHRLTTIVKADLILVIHGGRVIQIGTHEELHQKEGRYKELWSKQILVLPDRKKSSGQKPAEIKPADDGVSPDRVSGSNKSGHQIGAAAKDSAENLAKGKNAATKTVGDDSARAKTDRNTISTILEHEVESHQESKPVKKIDWSNIDDKAPKPQSTTPTTTGPHVQDLIQTLETKRSEEPLGKGSKPSQLKPDAPDFIPKRNFVPSRSGSLPANRQSETPAPGGSGITSASAIPDTKVTWAQRRFRKKKEKLGKDEEDKTHGNAGENSKDRLVKRSSSFFRRGKKQNQTQTQSSDPAQGSSNSLAGPTESLAAKESNTNLDGSNDQEIKKTPAKKRRHRKRKQNAALKKSHARNDTELSNSGSSSQLSKPQDVDSQKESSAKARSQSSDNEHDDYQDKGISHLTTRRRALSRSDPIADGQTDGSADEESPRQYYRPMSETSRHSSAPATIAYSQYDLRGSSQGQRRRRPRQLNNTPESSPILESRASPIGPTITVTADAGQSSHQSILSTSGEQGQSGLGREVHFADDS